jgi:hypothetical protein
MMHQLQRFPRSLGSSIPAIPDRVTMNVWLQAFPLDVFDKLFEKPDEQGFTADQVSAMRAKLAPFRVGPEVEWTAAAMQRSSYTDPTTRQSVYCVSNSKLFDFAADKTPAPKHRICSP